MHFKYFRKYKSSSFLFFFTFPFIFFFFIFFVFIYKLNIIYLHYFKMLSSLCFLSLFSSLNTHISSSSLITVFFLSPALFIFLIFNSNCYFIQLLFIYLYLTSYLVMVALSRDPLSTIVLLFIVLYSTSQFYIPSNNSNISSIK